MRHRFRILLCQTLYYFLIFCFSMHVFIFKLRITYLGFLFLFSNFNTRLCDCLVRVPLPTIIIIFDEKIVSHLSFYLPCKSFNNKIVFHSYLLWTFFVSLFVLLYVYCFIVKTCLEFFSIVLMFFTIFFFSYEK